MVTKKKLTKEEWEAMTGTDMSLILPSDGSIETARESSLNDTGNSERAKSVEQVEVPFEPQQPSTEKEEGRENFLWTNTGKPFFRSRESKTASLCLLAARYVTGWTSLSAGWEDAK